MHNAISIPLRTCVCVCCASLSCSSVRVFIVVCLPMLTDVTGSTMHASVICIMCMCCSASHCGLSIDFAFDVKLSNLFYRFCSRQPATPMEMRSMGLLICAKPLSLGKVLIMLNASSKQQAHECMYAVYECMRSSDIQLMEIDMSCGSSMFIMLRR